jgi:hypothetical protein
MVQGYHKALFQVVSDIGPDLPAAQGNLAGQLHPRRTYEGSLVVNPVPVLVDGELVPFRPKQSRLIPLDLIMQGHLFPFPGVTIIPERSISLVRFWKRNSVELPRHRDRKRLQSAGLSRLRQIFSGRHTGCLFAANLDNLRQTLRGFLRLSAA